MIFYIKQFWEIDLLIGNLDYFKFYGKNYSVKNILLTAQ